MAKDPVCGMDVDEREAEATAQHEGRTYQFCSEECQQKFEQNPATYVRAAS